MTSEPRLYPDRLGKVPRTGAVESVQAAELRLRKPLSQLLSRDFLDLAAREYWRLITRFTLGLVRVVSGAGEECVVLLARPLVLLRFHSPEFELREGSGSVTWRIERGILVSRDGRERGFLRLSFTEMRPPAGPGPGLARVQMEVRNFYPWLRGTGAFARVGVWVYAQTQQRIHRFVTRAFLRRLARAALLPDDAGKEKAGRGGPSLA